MALTDLTTFQQFVATFPAWRLVNIVDELYFMCANPLTQSDLAAFNPEQSNAPSIKPGPTLDFWLQRVDNVTFNGTLLSFQTHGYTYVCDGPNVTVKIIPHLT